MMRRVGLLCFMTISKYGLSRRIGRAGIIKIWRDPELDGSQLFDVTIQDKINNSALFLALSSPGHLTSEYCQQELQCFHKKCKNEKIGLNIRDRFRIFNILLNNIPREEWPEEYGRTSGFHFHDAKRPEEFGEALEPGSKEFNKLLRGLVSSIYKTLESCRDAVPAIDTEQVVIEAQPSDESFMVYFADVADSFRQTKKRTINEMLQKGIKVVSNIPPPFEALQHEQRVVEELNNTNLSIHLLDDLSGREIEGEPGKCYPQRQAELGIKHSDDQFIWVPHQLDIQNIEDDVYKNFIDHLENGTRGESKYNFVRGSSGTVVQEILEKVDQVKSQKQQNSASLAPAVLVDTHLKDLRYASKLIDFFDKKKIQLLLIQQEDDPQKNMNLLEERLGQVSALIIIFGQVKKDWVIERLGVALQLIVAKNYPVTACGIYLAPPQKKTEDIQFKQKFIEVQLLDNSTSDQFVPQSITPLLESMESGKPV